MGKRGYSHETRPRVIISKAVTVGAGAGAGYRTSLLNHGPRFTTDAEQYNYEGSHASIALPNIFYAGRYRFHMFPRNP